MLVTDLGTDPGVVSKVAFLVNLVVKKQVGPTLAVMLEVSDQRWLLVPTFQCIRRMSCCLLEIY